MGATIVYQSSLPYAEIEIRQDLLADERDRALERADSASARIVFLAVVHRRR